MTKEELAQKLNGREYGHEATREEREEAKSAGLVIVYGASDDLIEFDGAIYDEAGVWEGGRIHFGRDGYPKNECDESECPYFDRLLKSLPYVDAKWDCDGYSWKYETAFPVAEFDIFDEGEKYCRGIVFDLKDVFPE